MLRVACKCGKSLGVNDEFAGKQVRCPACLTVLNVPGPSASQPPRPHSPAPAPKPKKSPFGLLLWLFGAGAAALLLLAGLAVGVYLWFKTPETSAAKIYSLPFQAAVKVGDRREVKVTADYSLHSEIKSDTGGTQTTNKSNKAVFQATVRTLAVDDQGRETRRELSVEKFAVSYNAGPEKPALPAGGVYYLDGFGPKAALRSKDGSGVPNLAREWWPRLQAVAFEDTEQSAMQLFGNPDKQQLGATWPVRREPVARWLTKYAYELTPEAISGTVKLAGAPTEGEAGFLDFEADVTADLDAALAKDNAGGTATGKLQVTWSARYPPDNATGPLKRSLKVEIKVRKQGGPQAKVPDATEETTEVHHFTEEVKYLPPVETPVSSNPGRSGVVLDKVAVKRIVGGNELQVSFLYNAPPGSGAKTVWHGLLEFKGIAPPNDLANVGDRDTLKLEAAGEWKGQVRMEQAPAAGTPFILHISDEPLTTPEARKQASQLTGTVE